MTAFRDINTSSYLKSVTRLMDFLKIKNLMYLSLLQNLPLPCMSPTWFKELPMDPFVPSLHLSPERYHLPPHVRVSAPEASLGRRLPTNDYFQCCLLSEEGCCQRVVFPWLWEMAPKVFAPHSRNQLQTKCKGSLSLLQSLCNTHL